MEELKVTKESVVRAAEKCPAAREVLKEMFPEVFQVPSQIDLTKLTIDGHCNLFTHEQFKAAGLPGGCIQVRCGGRYSNGKAFFLDPLSCDWRLEKDGMSCTVLIPTPKK
jgi:hypothetical protein